VINLSKITNMKRIGIFGLSLLLFASCSMEQTQEDDIDACECDVVNLVLQITLVDQNLQDRLNPESPAYFGDDYCRGIEVLRLYGDRKLPLSGEDYTTIQIPGIPNYDGAMRRSSGGYYFMDISPGAPAEDGFSHIYVQYPDGNEDEVKVQAYKNESGSLLLIDKVWFNDELVYDMRGRDGSPGPDYYNPAYYPFLVPVLDGEHVRPAGGTNSIVVIK
jgi:hypothetical protein